MSVSVSIQRIERATARSVDLASIVPSRSFDVVDLLTSGGAATLFLPAGTGQSVADAINAAIAAEDQEAAA